MTEKPIENQEINPTEEVKQNIEANDEKKLSPEPIVSESDQVLEETKEKSIPEAEKPVPEKKEEVLSGIENKEEIKTPEAKIEELAVVDAEEEKKEEIPELVPEDHEEGNLEKEALPESDPTGLKKQEEEKVIEEPVEPVLEPKGEKLPEPKVESSDDFDWDEEESKNIGYNEQEREALEAMYNGTINTVTDNEITDATVVGLTDKDVVLNIGFKSDGMVSLTEFRDMPDLKTGDVVQVFVMNKEDKDGQLILSRKNAKLLNAWEAIVDSYENDTVVTGKVINKTKGGLIVDINGLETFLPGSQIDVKPIIDYDSYVGKTMEFKVVKINDIIKNAVVSHKALIERDMEEQRAEIIKGLEKGQVLEGIVKNITDFGAFIDLGGVDGLLYITDISWGRITHPNEVLELNQKINVAVLDFNDDKKRISLGLKQLQPHPWEALDKAIDVSSKVKGKIVNIEDYGAFLEIVPGVEGLIHVSEVSWSNQPLNARDYFKLGDEYEAAVVTIDREERRMSLSIKQLTSDPWEKVEESFAVGSKHSGIVKNITPYGVFVEFDGFFGGMVHISDLSWIKRYHHPSEVTKVGEEMDVIVMEIDKDNRKLNLSHKHIEEDPWDTFENVFPVESIHEGTIIKKDDKGAIVQLPYGLEGFLPNKHMKKEDGSETKLEETLPFMILEFNRNDKRIIVSHTRVISEQVEEIKKKERSEKSKRRKDTNSAINRLNRKAEKSTLGDLGVLSGLKKKMEKGEEEHATEKLKLAKKPAKKKAAKEKEIEAEKQEKKDTEDNSKE